MRTLRSKYLSDMIGTVTRLNDKWRITNWRPDGPSGHAEFSTDEALEREIIREWKDDPEAGQELERWSNTPEWELGLKRVQYITAWNTCSWHGRYDLARRLDHASTLDEALAIIPEIYQELKE